MLEMSVNVKEEQQKVFDLCEQIPPEIIIALAAAKRGWGISVCKPENDKAIVTGLIVGTTAFLAKHACEDHEKSKTVVQEKTNA